MSQQVPTADAVEDIRGIVAAVPMLSAMVIAQDCAGLSLEPAGALGMAASCAHPALFSAQRVAAVLTGSHTDRPQIDRYVRRRKSSEWSARSRHPRDRPLDRRQPHLTRFLQDRRTTPSVNRAVDSEAPLL